MFDVADLVVRAERLEIVVPVHVMEAGDELLRELRTTVSGNVDWHEVEAVNT